MQVRQKLEARRAEEARLDAQKRAPLTDRQIAELKNELAGHMLCWVVVLAGHMLLSAGGACALSWSLSYSDEPDDWLAASSVSIGCKEAKA
eukprot:1161790-Pelagomonas_calceolata.AAC.5